MKYFIMHLVTNKFLNVDGQWVDRVRMAKLFDTREEAEAEVQGIAASDPQPFMRIRQRPDVS